MWKNVARLAVLVVVGLLPISALAHTRLFYNKSYRSDYRKVEIVETTVTAELMITPEPTVEPTVTTFVEIPLESTLAPEPNPTPTPTLVPTEVPTEAPTEGPSSAPSVESMDSEDAEESLDQITTPSDIATP